MVADKPGASISVKFRTALGRVELHYLTSGTFGLGSVECSVDGSAKKVRFNGHANLRAGVNVGRAKVLAEGLAPGEHELTCVLLDATLHPGGGKEFRLISVLSV